MDYKYAPNTDPSSKLKGVFLNKGQLTCIVDHPQLPDFLVPMPDEPPGIIDVVVVRPPFNQDQIFALDGEGEIHLGRWAYSPPHHHCDWTLYPKNVPPNSLFLLGKVVALSNDCNGTLWCVDEGRNVWKKPVIPPYWICMWANIPDGEPLYDTYVVKQGDTLWNIVDTRYSPANAQGYWDYIDQIMALNPFIVDPNKLTIGWELKLPPIP